MTHANVLQNEIRLDLSDNDIVRLILDYLKSRQLIYSCLALEIESRVENGVQIESNEDMRFLQQLIMDGLWDSAVEFICPFQDQNFDMSRMYQCIWRAKLHELIFWLCSNESESRVDENRHKDQENDDDKFQNLEHMSREKLCEQLDSTLDSLSRVSTDNDMHKYTQICDRIRHHNAFIFLSSLDFSFITDVKDIRHRCWLHLHSLLINNFLGYLSHEKSTRFGSIACERRLVTLLVKALMYEQCETFCCNRAATHSQAGDCAPLSATNIGPSASTRDYIDGSNLSAMNSDAGVVASDNNGGDHGNDYISPHCFYSWLRSLPTSIFVQDFNYGAFNVNVSKLSTIYDKSLRNDVDIQSFVGKSIKVSNSNSCVNRQLSDDKDIISSTRDTLKEQQELITGDTYSTNRSQSNSKENRKKLLKGRDKVENPNERQIVNKNDTFAENCNATHRDTMTIVKGAVDGNSEQRDEWRYDRCNHSRSSHSVALSEGTSNVSTNQNCKSPSSLHSEKANKLPQSHEISSSIKMYNTSNIDGDPSKSHFIPITSLEDSQAFRCVQFHPNGRLYAVGSNSHTLRLCTYPRLDSIRADNPVSLPEVILQRNNHHSGSIYCLTWNSSGDFIATGSNDKSVRFMKFNSDSVSFDNCVRINCHKGTVRDVCFIEDVSSSSSLLVSAGAGDFSIYASDCQTAGSNVAKFSGHTSSILGLCTWGGATFASCSLDKSVRFWDLRCADCVQNVRLHSGSGAGCTSMAVDPSGRLLVSGHENSCTSLYDIRGARTLQTIRAHENEVRSVSFSPNAFYLLTASYDGSLALTDLQGDLMKDLSSVTVGQHTDKVISARWHVSDFTFVSASADRTCVLWSLPTINL